MSTAQSPTSSPFAEENRRILLIDDNVAIHEDYRKILVGKGGNSELDELEAALFDASPTSNSKHLNFEVSSAYQGQDGLSLVAQSLENNKPFAMAFVDMRMPPGWDGVETIKRIWEVDPNLQVVICSAYSDHSWSELVDALPSVGQWLLLRKPFDSAEVSQLALALTKKWELERQSRERVRDLEHIVTERTYELRQEMQGRLAAQVALRENDARIRAVFDTTQNGIVIFDEAGKLECANRAACQLFGIREEDVSQHNIVDLIVGPEGKSLAGSDASSYGANLADHAGFQPECRVIRQGDPGVAVSVKVSCFISCSQRMYAALLQDMTSFKQLQSELANANKLQTVSQLADGVASEIKTPLQFLADNSYFEQCFESIRKLVSKVEELGDFASENAGDKKEFKAIKTIAEGLRTNKVLEELPSAIHDSAEGVRRVHEIVNSMQYAMGGKHEPASSIELKSLIEESIAQAVRGLPSAPRIAFECEANLPKISGLSDRLRDAFANIVSNAVYATTSSNPREQLNASEIAVVARRVGRSIEVEIKDNGCGISEENLTKIFDPFFTTKAAGEGRGQSLAISRTTIEGHGGEITAESKLGSGSTFRVSLPSEKLALANQSV